MCDPSKILLEVSFGRMEQRTNRILPDGFRSDTKINQGAPLCANVSEFDLG